MAGATPNGITQSATSQQWPATTSASAAAATAVVAAAAALQNGGGNRNRPYFGQPHFIGRAPLIGSRMSGVDYWHKNGSSAAEAVRRQQQQHQHHHHYERDDNMDRSRAGAGAGGYQRIDRWQPRGVHSQVPPKLTAAQKRARGPLPDWDDCEEDSFDYMDLMESQYAQYYAVSTVPPFDPTSTGMDPALAAAFPNMMLHQAQQQMAALTFRPPQLSPFNAHLLSHPPPTMVAAAAAAAAVGESRPDSVASSLTSNTVPATPTALLSPSNATVAAPIPGTAGVSAIGPIGVPYNAAYPPISPQTPISTETLKEYIRKQM
ncbi:unnamed protein product [Gongylonema pulchrum]|uniref:FDF domain-containing protein n=1 Tax=Gongylonema pulchrum TaxID=637853 RepID=A0A183DRM1_9BILA|nr:unnamed protein product [Gongylonema pulchrum]